MGERRNWLDEALGHDSLDLLGRDEPPAPDCLRADGPTGYPAPHRARRYAPRPSGLGDRIEAPTVPLRLLGEGGPYVTDDVRALAFQESPDLLQGQDDEGGE